MLRSREPFSNDFPELFHRHAAVCNSDDLFEILNTEPHHRLAIMSEDRLEWLSLAPLRMLRRLRNHFVDGEGHLRVDRLLNPESAVIVKGRDPFLGLNEVGWTFLRYPLDESNNGFLGRGIIPGGQWVRLSERSCTPYGRSD